MEKAFVFFLLLCSIATMTLCAYGLGKNHIQGRVLKELQDVWKEKQRGLWGESEHLKPTAEIIQRVIRAMGLEI